MADVECRNITSLGAEAQEGSQRLRAWRSVAIRHFPAGICARIPRTRCGVLAKHFAATIAGGDDRSRSGGRADGGPPGGRDGRQSIRPQRCIIASSPSCNSGRPWRTYETRRAAHGYGTDELLLCRKKHTTSALIFAVMPQAPADRRWMPGARLREELGDVQVSEPEYIGVYSDPAPRAARPRPSISSYTRGSGQRAPTACSQMPSWSGSAQRTTARPG